MAGNLHGKWWLNSILNAKHSSSNNNNSNNSSHNNKRSQWNHSKVLIVTVTLSVIWCTHQTTLPYMAQSWRVCVLFVAVFAGLLSDFLYAKSTSGNNKTISGISQMSVTLPTASIKLIANWKLSPYTWRKRIHNQWMWHAIRKCQWDSFFPHFGWLQRTGGETGMSKSFYSICLLFNKQSIDQIFRFNPNNTSANFSHRNFHVYAIFKRYPIKINVAPS